MDEIEIQCMRDISDVELNSVTVRTMLVACLLGAVASVITTGVFLAGLAPVFRVVPELSFRQTLWVVLIAILSINTWTASSFFAYKRLTKGD